MRRRPPPRKVGQTRPQAARGRASIHLLELSTLLTHFHPPPRCRLVMGDTSFARPSEMSGTWKLRWWTFLRVPMAFFLSPSVVEASARRVVIRIPLTWRSKNHLGSMYFGALCVGADLAGGLLALR